MTALYKIPELENFSWKHHVATLSKPSKNQLSIIKRLISDGKADPFEIIETDTGKTWPLFIACEKNNTELFNVIIPYATLDNINWQNEKGSTCLWMTACNRHTDMTIELLNQGANPNLANFKGDTKNNTKQNLYTVDTGHAINKIWYDNGIIFIQLRNYNFFTIDLVTGEKQLVDMPNAHRIRTVNLLPSSLSMARLHDYYRRHDHHNQ